MFTFHELGQTIGYRYYNLLASSAKRYIFNVLNWALLDFILCKTGLDDPDVDEGVEHSMSAPASCTLGPLDRSCKIVVTCCAT